MRLDELNDRQKIQLKQNILVERRDHIGESPSYAELAMADDLVSDEDMEDWYAGTVFSEDDFA